MTAPAVENPVNLNYPKDIIQIGTYVQTKDGRIGHAWRRDYVQRTGEHTNFADVDHNNPLLAMIEVGWVDGVKDNNDKWIRETLLQPYVGPDPHANK